MQKVLLELRQEPVKALIDIVEIEQKKGIEKKETEDWLATWDTGFNIPLEVAHKNQMRKEDFF